ncbi:YrhK family protein [Salinisphaera orenii]|uniref:YrhK family protein n=1 Tax=Salinisphaera orenii TaxID=856731 RepID=UPI000DBEA4BD
MAHLVTNRPRVGSPQVADPDHPAHDWWELVSLVVYELGAALFIGGSIFFLPALASSQFVGAWLFLIGSILYLVVTGHDLLEVVRFWRLFFTRTLGQTLELLASLNYVTGSLLFAVGSVFFLPSWDWPVAGAWLFVLGSVAFVVGASVNLLQVFESPTLAYLELFNLTVAWFAVGSVLFLVASVPYLWDLHSNRDATLVMTYAGFEYMAGSILFLSGGLMIHLRYRVRRRHAAAGGSRTSVLTGFVRREVGRYGRLGS